MGSHLSLLISVLVVCSITKTDILPVVSAVWRVALVCVLVVSIYISVVGNTSPLAALAVATAAVMVWIFYSVHPAIAFVVIGPT